MFNHPTGYRDRGDEQPELPPMDDRTAVATVQAIAGGYTLVACSCSLCPTGVRVSRVRDGLCPVCDAAGCDPFAGYVACGRRA